MIQALLRRYIRFLDKLLPAYFAAPALFQILMEYRNHLESKLQSWDE